MPKITIFICGVGAGLLAGMLFSHHFLPVAPALQPPPSPISAAPASGAGEDMGQVKPPIERAKPPQAQANRQAFSFPQVTQAHIEHLLTVFRQQEDDLYSSHFYKDLTYFVRHNERIAEQVKERIQQSSSYDERVSLVSVLAHNENPATLAFAISLLESLDKETQSLGFDLLLAMGDRGRSPELNAALLEASHYETDPTTLSNIINHLSVGELDPQSKQQAIDSFQRLMVQSENATVKARAIDGLRRLGDQDAIMLAVLDNLNHPEENVKTATISALTAVDKQKVTPEIIEFLRSIAANPQESNLTREYADMFLRSYDS